MFLRLMKPFGMKDLLTYRFLYLVLCDVKYIWYVNKTEI